MPTSEKKNIQNSDSYRNWANLPWDVLGVIFKMIGTLQLIIGADTVCKEWWKLAHQPRIWKEVQFFVKDRHVYDIKGMAFLSIHRSAGCLVEFFCMDRFGDELLKCISESSPKLKRLGINCDGVSESALIKACEKLPLLEELNISNFNMKAEGLKSLSNSCQNIKNFRFMHIPSNTDNSVSNELAIGIAKYMPHLNKLLIGGDKLDEKGVITILKGCRQLSEFYLMECYKITYSKQMCRRLYDCSKRGALSYNHVNLNISYFVNGNAENDPILEHGEGNHEDNNA